jgi:hypothetical protein
MFAFSCFFRLTGGIRELSEKKAALPGLIIPAPHGFVRIAR